MSLMNFRTPGYDTIYYRGMAIELARDAALYDVEPQQIKFGKDLKEFAKKHNLDAKNLYRELQGVTKNDLT